MKYLILTVKFPFTLVKSLYKEQASTTPQDRKSSFLHIIELVNGNSDPKNSRLRKSRLAVIL